MPDADAAPAPVTLFHEHWPNGREFDPVVAETMRLQGWTDTKAKADKPDPAAKPAPTDRTNPGA